MLRLSKYKLKLIREAVNIQTEKRGELIPSNFMQANLRMSVFLQLRRMKGDGLFGKQQQPPLI